jgi:hypothetical protein
MLCRKFSEGTGKSNKTSVSRLVASKRSELSTSRPQECFCMSNTFSSKRFWWWCITLSTTIIALLDFLQFPTFQKRTRHFPICICCVPQVRDNPSVGCKGNVLWLVSLVTLDPTTDVPLIWRQEHMLITKRCVPFYNAGRRRKFRRVLISCRRFCRQRRHFPESFWTVTFLPTHLAQWTKMWHVCSAKRSI